MLQATQRRRCLRAIIETRLTRVRRRATKWQRRIGVCNHAPRTSAVLQPTHVQRSLMGTWPAVSCGSRARRWMRPSRSFASQGTDGERKSQSTDVAESSVVVESKRGGGVVPVFSEGVRRVRVHYPHQPFQKRPDALGWTHHTTIGKKSEGKSLVDRGETRPGTFGDIAGGKLNKQLAKVIRSEKRFTQPSLVQHEAIPYVMSGRTTLIQSPTGTGKTMAYVLPIVSALLDEFSGLAQKTKNGAVRKADASDPSPYIRHVILAPSHELCMQISREIRELLDVLLPVNPQDLYGYDPFGSQALLDKGLLSIESLAAQYGWKDIYDDTAIDEWGSSARRYFDWRLQTFSTPPTMLRDTNFPQRRQTLPLRPPLVMVGTPRMIEHLFGPHYTIDDFHARFPDLKESDGSMTPKVERMFNSWMRSQHAKAEIDLLDWWKQQGREEFFGCVDSSVSALDEVTVPSGDPEPPLPRSEAGGKKRRDAPLPKPILPDETVACLDMLLNDVPGVERVSNKDLLQYLQDRSVRQKTGGRVLKGPARDRAVNKFLRTIRARRAAARTDVDEARSVHGADAKDNEGSSSGTSVHAEGGTDLGTQVMQPSEPPVRPILAVPSWAADSKSDFSDLAAERALLAQANQLPAPLQAFAVDAPLSRAQRRSHLVSLDDPRGLGVSRSSKGGGSGGWEPMPPPVQLSELLPLLSQCRTVVCDEIDTLLELRNYYRDRYKMGSGYSRLAKPKPATVFLALLHYVADDVQLVGTSATVTNRTRWALNAFFLVNHPVQVKVGVASPPERSPEEPKPKETLDIDIDDDGEEEVAFMSDMQRGQFSEEHFEALCDELKSLRSALNMPDESFPWVSSTRPVSEADTLVASGPRSLLAAAESKRDASGKFKVSSDRTFKNARSSQPSSGANALFATSRAAGGGSPGTDEWHSPSLRRPEMKSRAKLRKRAVAREQISPEVDEWLEAMESDLLDVEAGRGWEDEGSESEGSDDELLLEDSDDEDELLWGSGDLESSPAISSASNEADASHDPASLSTGDSVAADSNQDDMSSSWPVHRCVLWLYEEIGKLEESLAGQQPSVSTESDPSADSSRLVSSLLPTSVQHSFVCAFEDMRPSDEMHALVDTVSAEQWTRLVAATALIWEFDNLVASLVQTGQDGDSDDGIDFHAKYRSADCVPRRVLVVTGAAHPEWDRIQATRPPQREYDDPRNDPRLQFDMEGGFQTPTVPDGFHSTLGAQAVFRRLGLPRVTGVERFLAREGRIDDIESGTEVAQQQRGSEETAGDVEVIVCPAGAVRGLDLPDVPLVLVAMDPFSLGAELYAHIAGRTGRAGSAGKVITVVREEGNEADALFRVAGQPGFPVAFRELTWEFEDDEEYWQENDERGEGGQSSSS